MSRLFLGIDVGTSSTKALVVRDDGVTVCCTSSPYPLLTPQERWVEQRPADWWDSLVSAVRKATAGVDKGSIASIGLSTQGNTVFLADEAGQPLGNAITWLDQRATTERDELVALKGEDFWYQRTGLALSPAITLTKLRWLSNHMPDLVRRASWVLLVGDYILYQLTGRFCTDIGNAASTMLYDFRRNQWDPDLLRAAGVRLEQMPPIMESGSLLGPLAVEAARVLDLPAGIPVAVGGFDQCCAAIGAGSVESGQSLLSCGSAWVITYNAETPILDAGRRVWVQRHSIPGKFAILAVMSNGGVVVDWVLDQLTGGAQAGKNRNEIRNALLARLPELPPGSSKLLFLPHFVGAPSPNWQPDARGALLGMKLSDGGTEMFKAALEGLGFEVMWNVGTVESLGFPVNTIRMIGGAANSPTWAQLLADVTGRVVVVPGNKESAALGAATLAAWSVGAWRSGAPTVPGEAELSFQPDPARASVYRRLSGIYREAFTTLLGLFQRLNAVDTHLL